MKRKPTSHTWPAAPPDNTLHVDTTGLNAWERQVLLFVIRDTRLGLLEGVTVYGHWDPLTDDRILVREARQELRDARIYDAMSELQVAARQEQTFSRWIEARSKRKAKAKR
jgi:hypothetical protein